MHLRHAASSLLALVLATAALTPAAAQRHARATPPSGGEIASKARAARLDQANAGTGEFQGKKITFTPAELPTRTDLGIGQVIGVLETEVAGDETGLPPGTYNVMAAQLADGWHVYAESGGQVVKEAVKVRLEKRADQAVSPSSMQVLTGESKQFTLELRDSRGNLLTGRTITWTSSAPGVAATAGTGMAKGMAPGTATFTATSEGKSASASVTVPQPQYTMSIGFGSSGWIRIGGTWQLWAVIKTTQCYTCPSVNVAEIGWTNNNPAVATVQKLANGQATVTGVADGLATITATYRGASASITLRVAPVPVASVNLSQTSLALPVGQSAQLTATVRDSTGATLTDRAVTWASSAPSVADVASSTGRVLGVALGTATITATSEGKSAGAVVSVTPVPVASVVVTPNPVTVGVNEFTAPLEVTVRDAKGNVLTDRTVTWRTGNPTMADVTGSGRVAGVAPGTTTITATVEGHLGSTTVTVSSPPATLSFNW